MTAWTGKPCHQCGKKKGLKQADKKYCFTCAHLVRFAASEKEHRGRIARTYGIPPEAYDAIYFAQNGRCFICQRATGKTRRLSVDHDHKTRRVRGLLCRTCNNLLGHARDDPEFFRRALQYLLFPPAESILERPDG